MPATMSLLAAGTKSGPTRRAHAPQAPARIVLQRRCVPAALCSAFNDWAAKILALGYPVAR